MSRGFWKIIIVKMHKDHNKSLCISIIIYFLRIKILAYTDFGLPSIIKVALAFKSFAFEYWSVVYLFVLYGSSFLCVIQTISNSSGLCLSKYVIGTLFVYIA
jgi:hypothetical protein